MKLDGNRQRELAALMWNGGGAQMTAAIAFGVVVLAVIVSVQPGSILKDLIAGFGAAGQVFFAGMVWKLSQRQFEFTKSVAERQERIDLLPSREAAAVSFHEAHRAIDMGSVDQDAIAKIVSARLRANPLFSDEVGNLLIEYSEKVMSLLSLSLTLKIARENFRSPSEVAEILNEKFSKYTEITVLWNEINNGMNAEMKVR